MQGRLPKLVVPEKALPVSENQPTAAQQPQPDLPLPAAGSEPKLCADDATPATSSVVGVKRPRHKVSGHTSLDYVSSPTQLARHACAQCSAIYTTCMPKAQWPTLIWLHTGVTRHMCICMYICMQNHVTEACAEQCFFVLKQQLHSTTCMCCHLCIQVKSIYIPSSKHSKANFIRIGHHFVCASSTSLLVVLCLSDQPVLPTADDDEPRRRRLPYQVASIPSAPQPHPKSGRPIPLIIEDSLEPILSFASWPSVTTPKSARHEMQDKLRPSNQSICSHRCLG